eukprot:INCI7305.1.p1 GENE.INCI7305.1~~INCI7305.1.p1  ORF type:complete len:195 (+),score=21.37 INCI7305.1:212-796(+)
MSLVTFRSLARGCIQSSRTLRRVRARTACDLTREGSVLHCFSHTRQCLGTRLHAFQRTFSTQSPKADDDQQKHKTPRVGSNERDGHDDNPKSLKAMFKLYGPVYVVYGGVVWISTGVALYGVLATTGVDVLPAIAAVDDALGWSLASRIDPSLGLVAVSVALNELLEIVRFPFCVATTPAIARRWKAFRSARNF